MKILFEFINKYTLRLDLRELNRCSMVNGSMENKTNSERKENVHTVVPHQFFTLVGIELQENTHLYRYGEKVKRNLVKKSKRSENRRKCGKLVRNMHEQYTRVYRVRHLTVRLRVRRQFSTGPGRWDPGYALGGPRAPPSRPRPAQRLFRAPTRHRRAPTRRRRRAPV